MNKDFEEYKQAKLTLYHMICQTYDSDISKEDADKYNIEYKESDIYSYNGKVGICFHQYNPIGQRAWQLLGLDNSMISFSKILDLESNVMNEEFNENKNYTYEKLKIELVLLYMLLDYYSYEISKEEADNMRIKYDEIFDTIEDRVKVCDNYCENAGELAWRLFKIEDNLVPNSYFEDKKIEIKKQLLKIDYDSNIRRNND